VIRGIELIVERSINNSGIKERLDSLEARMDSLESKVDGLTQRFDEFETKVDNRLNRLTAQVIGLREDVKANYVTKFDLGVFRDQIIGHIDTLAHRLHGVNLEQKNNLIAHENFDGRILSLERMHKITVA
jgi:hypothetical protein